MIRTVTSDSPKPQARGAILALYIAALLIGVVAPWIILGVQEKIRYGSSPQHLWPWITMSTWLHVAAIAALLLMPTTRKFLEARSSAQISTRARRLTLGVTLAGAAVLAASFCINTINYLELLWREPISPFNGDMLPLIEMSLREFWANHRYPYHFYDVAHWQIPLTYFPGIWLPYTLPWAFGVDIRMLQAPCYLAMSMMLLFHTIRQVTSAHDWVSYIEAVPPALIGLAIFSIPSFRGFLPALHLIPFWMFVVCWCVYFLNRHWFVSGFSLGLCVISRPYLVAVAPFLLLWCVWNWRQNRRGVLLHCVGAAIPCLFFGAPFFLANPQAFLYGVLEWYDRASQYHLQNERWRTHGFGFSGLLWELSGAQYTGIFRQKMTITWICEAILLALVWKRLKTPAQLLRASAAAIFIMLYFTVIPFFYTFACPLIIAAIAQARDVAPDEPMDKPSCLWSHWLRWGFAAFLTFALAIILFHALYRPPMAKEIDGLDASRPVLAQVKLISGFSETGWAANDLSNGRQFTDAHAYIGLPAIEQSSPSLQIYYWLENPRPNTNIAVHLNGEPIGFLPLDTQPARSHRFQIPRANLFRGTNLIRFEVMSGDYTLSADQVQDLQLSLWQITLDPPAPLPMVLTR